MELMIVTGAVALVFGIMFLVCPAQLDRWSQRGNATIGRWLRSVDPTLRFDQPDQTVLRYRISTGICLIGVGVFCLSSAYYVWLRLHL